MRLLHAGHDHGGCRIAGGESEPNRGRGPPRARRQPLPLHRLPQHRQGRPGGGRKGRGGDGVSTTGTEATGTAKGATEEKGGWVGRAMRRKEDPRLITGRGSYTDNM